ncbi:ammonium transporter [Dendrothele bispora CBS 962.96]|uniref:Ammonium transporter n=1 Tax=Dendrothele bispora (strain CBS 962.96) TaxID=1314807 RepID=A0A4S8MTU7_DENBC|nr:ammonium transporter [Dendrothele bispora CBS 962.96]
MDPFSQRQLGRRADPQYDLGDVSFIIVAGAMVLLMIPGLAFLYSGLARRKSALSLIWVVSAGNAVTIFQWFFWGYSLAFSSSATNGYIGNLRNFGLMKVLGDPSPGSPLIPELLYSFFQMEFACVTVCILLGGIAERGRMLPAMVFTFVWVTLVYCPLACWPWGVNGWAFKWGVLDFAGKRMPFDSSYESLSSQRKRKKKGGGPVEIGSGVSGLAFAWVLGRRQEKELINFRPHNVSLVCLGTFLLWFGWLGFNGGSAFGANLRAIMAIWNSMLAAAFGGMVWCLLDYRYERRWSMVGFCSGTIAGLVAATPSSGFVHPWASVIIGILSGGLCNLATKLKFLLRIDDALDLFAEHAVGGIIGLLMNGFFGTNHIIALDGVNTDIPGGFMDRNWKQLYIQFAYICAASGYSFVVTAVIAKGIDMIPGLHLRGTPEDERLGLDEVEIGEFATDYIELRRNFTDGFAPDGPQHFAAGDRHGHAETGLHRESLQANGRSKESSTGLSTVEEKPANGHVE